MSIANSLELGMLAMINGARGAAGLEPLRLITLLNQAAEAHSAWMLEADSFGHDGDDGTSPADRMAEAGYPFEGATLALENIGWQSARGDAGYEDDIAQIHDSLMASPEHRANILNPDARDIGIGVETGTFPGLAGDVEAVMVTQVFGATDADMSAWVDPGTLDDDVMPEVDLVAEDDGVQDMPDDPADDEIPDEEEVVMEDDGDDCGAPVADAPPGEDVLADEEVPVVEDDSPVPDEGDGMDDPVMEDAPTGEETADGDELDDPVMEDTPPAGDVDDEDMPDEDLPNDEDIVMENDDTDGDVEDEDDSPALPTLPHVALPCGLESFTVDLSGAFEFRKEGDQYIWETSEDKLIEAFLSAFEDWAGVPDEADGDVIDVMAEDDDPSLDDLLTEDLPRLPVEPLPADDLDDEAEELDLIAFA